MCFLVVVIIFFVFVFGEFKVVNFGVCFLLMGREGILVWFGDGWRRGNFRSVIVEDGVSCWV